MAEEKKEGETGPATSLADIAADSAESALGAAPKKDLSAVLQAKQPEAEQLARSGKLSEATELLFGVEKQARLANDIATLKQAALLIVRLCHEAKDWDAVGRNATTISKRRAQRGVVVAAVVQEAMAWIDEIDDPSVKEQLVVVLRDVSEGKIFAEKERAQLTTILAGMKEAAGKVAEAADIMQEVHVETYGALTKMEKLTFILEQVRLLLAKRDYVRAHIVSKKVQRKSLDEPGFEQIKVKFYQLMITYHTHEKEVFELYKCHHAIYDTAEFKPDGDVDGDAAMADGGGGDKKGKGGEDDDKKKQDQKKGEAGAEVDAEEAKRVEDEKEKVALAAEHGTYLAQRTGALQHATVFLMLSEYSEEQNAALEALTAHVEKRIEAGADQGGDLAPYSALLKALGTPEIATWPLPQDAVLRAHPVLAAGGGAAGAGEENASAAAAAHAERATEWYEVLHKRVVEKNLRAIAGCYSRIRTAHLATLLGLSAEAVEERLAALVVSDTIYARIDRPAGIVSFTKPRPPEEVLDDWAGDIAELLDLVSTTSRLINKEMMVHKLQ